MQNTTLLELIGRKEPLLQKDIETHSFEIESLVQKSSFLVIGSAGSIGQAVTKEIFKRHPKLLHAVDINENNLVELVRDIRSSFGYIDGEFKTYAIDCGSLEFETLINSNSYDYVLNLSALKHVRSEKDPYTLMRMVEVNILNTIKTLKLSEQNGVKKYFCVSSDKAANPANMMGASKRIMELFLSAYNSNIKISTARFANVAFSDGSLPHGFIKRIEKRQPISAPNDIKRYFITPQESGELCLMSCLLGENQDIFFPKLSEELNLIKFSDIAKRYLKSIGYNSLECASEEEARQNSKCILDGENWPCYFFKSDTTGEKDFEEFYVEGEKIDLTRFINMGVVKNENASSKKELDTFLSDISILKNRNSWIKEDILKIFFDVLPNFQHKEKGKYLDDKM
jgi:FlaA1/EpsC-like NDP-sugar epimerase